MSRFVTCEPRGVSRGMDRFPNREQHPIKEWRCELTALSQRYNLYFVGCNSEIRVYQPSFPDQAITGEPCIVLDPPHSQDSNDALYEHPGVDEEHPHSINRILVDYLGNDEILLVACDDGDVIVYRVDEIQKALEAQSKDHRSRTAAEAIRVFFRRHVRCSAWGIAVHREARMLAFSANTHRITIIAFALSDQSQGTQEPDFSDTASGSIDEDGEPDFPARRKRDHIFRFQARSNIPSIAFDNTGKDPEGRWLISSSIDGVNILIDLHKKRLNMTLQMGWCVSALHSCWAPLPHDNDSECKCVDKLNVPHAAWGAMFLDTSFAHKVDSTDEIEPEQDPKELFLIDATKQKKRFTIRGGYNSGEPQVALEGDDSPMLLDDDTDDSMSASETSAAADFDASDEDAMDIDSTEEEDDEDFQDLEEQQVSEPLGTSDEDVMLSADGTLGVVSGPVTGTQWPRLYFNATHLLDDKNSHTPYLIITKGEIYLIQRPHAAYHVITLRHPLHPGPPKHSLPSYDRHCYFAQVPELGIFIVASPLGRAAIFSLTRYNNRHSSCGFRLEYILPFAKDDEEEVCGSYGRLAGIAVGPVQGMLDREGTEDGYDARRYGEGMWRLLMYYANHTVVGYELGRRSGGGDVGLRDIVV